jgi:hypothetical protein
MPEWLTQVLTAAVTAGATYGAIRSDLRHLHEQIEDLKRAAGEAHRRIDDLLLRSTP